MRKGITPIVATVILLLVVIAIAGAAYTYITGYWGSLTKNVVEMTSAVCTGSTVTMYLRNAGNAVIDAGSGSTDISISRSIVAGAPTGAMTLTRSNATGACAGANCLLNPRAVVTFADSACGIGTTCRYTIQAGGGLTKAQVTCR